MPFCFQFLSSCEWTAADSCVGTWYQLVYAAQVWPRHFFPDQRTLHWYDNNNNNNHTYAHSALSGSATFCNIFNRTDLARPFVSNVNANEINLLYISATDKVFDLHLFRDSISKESINRVQRWWWWWWWWWW